MRVSMCVYVCVCVSHRGEESSEELLSVTRTSQGAFKAGTSDEFTLKSTVHWPRKVKIRAVRVCLSTAY